MLVAGEVPLKFVDSPPNLTSFSFFFYGMLPGSERDAGCQRNFWGIVVQNLTHVDNVEKLEEV